MKRVIYFEREKIYKLQNLNKLVKSGGKINDQEVSWHQQCLPKVGDQLVQKISTTYMTKTLIHV